MVSQLMLYVNVTDFGGREAVAVTVPVSEVTCEVCLDAVGQALHRLTHGRTGELADSSESSFSALCVQYGLQLMLRVKIPCPSSSGTQQSGVRLHGYGNSGH